MTPRQPITSYRNRLAAFAICGCVLITSAAMANDFFVTDWARLESNSDVLLFPNTGFAGERFEIGSLSIESRLVIDVEPFQNYSVHEVQFRQFQSNVEEFELPGFNGNVAVRDLRFSLGSVPEFSERDYDINPGNGVFLTRQEQTGQSMHIDFEGQWDNFAFSHEFQDDGRMNVRITLPPLAIDPNTYPSPDSIRIDGNGNWRRGLVSTTNGGPLSAPLEPNYNIHFTPSFGSPVDDTINKDDQIFFAYDGGGEPTEPSFIRGDVNFDGIVDAQDLNKLGQNWLLNVTGIENGDLTGNGIVDAQDLNVVGQNWLKTSNTAQPAAVPEPSSAVIALLGLITIGTMRRKDLKNHVNEEVPVD